MDERETIRRLTESLPIATWLQQFSVRDVEKRLRRYGLSQRAAKIAISQARQ